MELKEKKVVTAFVSIDDSFQEELLKEFYQTTIEYLNKFELHLFEYTDTKDIAHIGMFKMDIHSLIGSALSVELKSLATHLYKFDEVITLHREEKSTDSSIAFYYFLIDKFRSFIYQLEKKENTELVEKVITSTLDRKGEGEKAYLIRSIKELEIQIESLKKELEEIDKKTKEAA